MRTVKQVFVGGVILLISLVTAVCGSAQSRNDDKLVFKTIEIDGNREQVGYQALLDAEPVYGTSRALSFNAEIAVRREHGRFTRHYKMKTIQLGEGRFEDLAGHSLESLAKLFGPRGMVVDAGDLMIVRSQKGRWGVIQA